MNMDTQIAFWIAQSISIVTTVIAVLCMQLKNMNWILICQITANALAGTTYFFLDGSTDVCNIFCGYFGENRSTCSPSTTALPKPNATLAIPSSARS